MQRRVTIEMSVTAKRQSVCGMLMTIHSDIAYPYSADDRLYEGLSYTGRRHAGHHAKGGLDRHYRPSTSTSILTAIIGKKRPSKYGTVRQVTIVNGSLLCQVDRMALTLRVT